jgi:hypothetical protein
MAQTNANAVPPETDESITLQAFLENIPPGRKVLLAVSSFEKKWAPGSPVTAGSGHHYLFGNIPEISLHCTHPSCDRVQYFRASMDSNKDAAGFVVRTEPFDLFLYYVCRNCAKTFKTFSLRILSTNLDVSKVFGFKFGETPPFGPPLPAKLLQLAGAHGDLLKKGRQSENQSLGIGAFAHYRRVVELQKSRLIDELENAIERLGGNPKAIATLESVREEGQFSKALEQMADVTPKELFVSGQNPLKLLHGPLSIGLHGLSDEECLQKAHSIRVVMAALLERIQMVTEEKSELDAAIKDLLAPATQKAKSSE